MNSNLEQNKINLQDNTQEIDFKKIMNFYLNSIVSKKLYFMNVFFDFSFFVIGVSLFLSNYFSSYSANSFWYLFIIILGWLFDLSFFSFYSIKISNNLSANFRYIQSLSDDKYFKSINKVWRVFIFSYFSFGSKSGQYSRNDFFNYISTIEIICNDKLHINVNKVFYNLYSKKNLNKLFLKMLFFWNFSFLSFDNTKI